MFGQPRPGSWEISSKKDPRWKASGRSEAILVTSGPPDECIDAFNDLQKLYGEPPDDLEYSVMKD